MIDLTVDGWESWKLQRETKYAAEKIAQEQSKLLIALAQRSTLESEARFELLGMYEALGFVLELMKEHKPEGIEPTGDSKNESVYRDFDKFINRIAAARVSGAGAA